MKQCSTQYRETKNTLVQPEVDFHVDHDGNGLAIFTGGIELPLLYGFDGLLVEPHAQSALYTNLLRTPIRVHHQPQHNGSLVLRLASLLGVLWIRRVERFGCAYSAAHAIGSAAVASSVSRTNAWPCARTNATAISASDSATCSGAVGRRTHHLGKRVANLVFGELRQRTFGSLQFVAITSATTATCLGLRGWQRQIRADVRH